MVPGKVFLNPVSLPLNALLTKVAIKMYDREVEKGTGCSRNDLADGLFACAANFRARVRFLLLHLVNLRQHNPLVLTKFEFYFEKLKIQFYCQNH